MSTNFSEFAKKQKERLLKSLAKGFIEQSIENEILNKSGNMEKYNYTIIEDWWRHLGCYDREQVSGEPYVKGHIQIYLELTDYWWGSLTNEKKKEIYEEFFNEN